VYWFSHVNLAVHCKKYSKLVLFVTYLFGERYFDSENLLQLLIQGGNWPTHWTEHPEKISASTRAGGQSIV
jgi:hypothetical protein